MNRREVVLTEKELRRKTIFGIGSLIIFFLACMFAWKWLHHQPREAGAAAPLRSALNNNERLFSGMFGSDRISQTYRKQDAVSRPRVNGNAGLSDDVDPLSWRLNVVRNAQDTLAISLPDIQALEKTEVIFDFKCIEGWSQVTHWGGVRFSDFVKHYKLSQETLRQFGGFVTPDGGYYVGIDMKSLMHPQTLLCYEINGKPLPLNQGAPLRLIIPVKYGVKHIKRIGTLFFSNSRPRDYWYERGYDYYCGL